MTAKLDAAVSSSLVVGDGVAASKAAILEKFPVKRLVSTHEPPASSPIIKRADPRLLGCFRVTRLGCFCVAHEKKLAHEVMNCCTLHRGQMLCQRS